MVTEASGFEELPHTADWSIRVWAASLPGLFVEAALGMNALAGIQPAPTPRVARIFSTQAADDESLLVLFLSELVYAAEQEHLVFESFDIKIASSKLTANMSGASILSISKSIKAVTYHNLQIRKTRAGFQVEIVFDV